MEDASFPLFLYLPFELRAKIWSFALYVPRIVEVRCRKVAAQHGDGRRMHAQRFVSSSALPPLLHACHESRCQALQLYTPSFGIPDSTPVRSGIVGTPVSIDQETVRGPHAQQQLQPPSPPAIFVAFDLDTLRLVATDLRYLQAAELRLMRSLIVDVNDYSYFAHYHMDRIVECTTLQRLDLMARQGARQSWERDLPASFLRDFDEAREANPNWVMPQVGLVDQDTGKLLAVYHYEDDG
ncbi:MAG: hypothetical protein M1818_003066 [Claussenomyces sp. TS43310]|nr:MAG: hypothetical protein M1818_003066 [Claussenomyces sp. TS43310]